MTTHSVTTLFNAPMAFTASIDGHDVKMDATADDGGEDSGPSPKRLMLASLAGCTGIDIVSILNKMKVGFSDFSINVHAALSAEHPKIYNLVKITYKIKLADGSIKEGTLDGDGRARVDGIEPGSAQVCFPNIGTEWKPA